jgi:hypothetical protein
MATSGRLETYISRSSRPGVLVCPHKAHQSMFTLVWAFDILSFFICLQDPGMFPENERTVIGGYNLMAI